MNIPNRRALLLVLNLLAFQLAWFACVLSAASDVPAWGIAAAVAAVCLQLLLGNAAGRDAVLVIVAMLIGLAWDTSMARIGVVQYASPGPVVGFAPAWILALWALFATTLREPLRWLHGRWRLAAFFGGVGGALSYWGAVRLGAGHFPDFALAMAVLAAGWAVITPALVEFASWLDTRKPIR